MADLPGDTGEENAGKSPGEPRRMEAPELETIGERVAWLRDWLSLSLQEFGRRIGYDGSQISRIERNRCQVVDRFIKVVCIKFRVREVWLRVGRGPVFLEDGEGGEGGPGSEGIARDGETKTPAELTWDDAWRDLKSYVDLLERLSPRGRAELAPKLHSLVTRLCATNDPDDDFAAGRARLREGEEDGEDSAALDTEDPWDEPGDWTEPSEDPAKE